MNIDPNLPAFPQPIDDMGTLTSVTSGLTIRQYFAAMAMQGLMIDCNFDRLIPGTDKREYELAAERAVKMADALIAELNKEGK